MREGDMPIANVLKEMNLVSVEEEACCDRVYWGVAPSFIKEAAILVQGLEEIDVCW